MRWLAPISSHGRNHERIFAGDAAVGPTLSNDLGLRPEPKPFLTILPNVAEARTFPAAETVVRDRHRYRHVHADHSNIHSRGEFARGMAVAGEDRDAISIFVL